METILFVAILGLLVLSFLVWGVRNLSREEWQIAATLPVTRLPDGSWRGVNITFYGLLIGIAQVAAVAVLFVLVASLGISPWVAVAMLGAVMIVCLPSSRLIARWVEGKANTLTVGGASFLGILLSPPLAWLILHYFYPDGAPALLAPVLAAMAICYVLGEGMGRLACISFGCCYGKPLAQCGPALQRIFEGRAVVFHGKTRKIAYGSGLDGQEVLPVQALTAFLYTLTALLSLSLFFAGFHGAAFVIAIAATQAWRFVSEFLRADHRGGGSLSLYQCFALASIVYSAIIVAILPETTLRPELFSGLEALADPGLLLFLPAWGLGIVFFTGISRVTGSVIFFHVHEDRI